MRVSTLATGFGLTLSLLLSGCGTNAINSAATMSTTTAASTSTVNLVVSDTPPTNITVLSFQVQITGATLQPGGVSLLPRPVTVDLAQLASDTGFLASSVIGSGTYTSLTLTYANPQVTFINTGATAVTAGSQTCAAGATCTYTPALNNASVTISSGVFPLTVTASSTTGLNLDLSIPDLLQSDLSVTLANGSSVNLSLLPAPSSLTAQAAAIDDVFGTITAINGSQVNMTTAFGDTLVLTSSSTTQYSFPASVCATPAASCLATGQEVTADLSLLGNGGLAVDTLSFVGSSSAPLVKAIVLGVNTTGASPTAQVLLQRTLNESSLSAGQIATVTLPSGTAYAIGAPRAPGVSGGTFSSALDLLPGQELVLNVASNLVTGTAPTFTTSTVYLESSQIVGAISTVNTASTSLTVNGLSGLFTATRPFVQQIDVQAGGTTTYTGYTVASFTALAPGQFLVAKGPLFNTTGTAGYPTLAAMQIHARANGN